MPIGSVKALVHRPTRRHLSLWSAAAVVAAVALALALVLPVQAAGLCSAPWMHNGSRVRLDGNGKTSMIVEFTLHDVSHDMRDDCKIDLHIYIKSGSVALGGRPIETVQEHQLLMGEAGVITHIVSVNGRAFTQSEHADLVGTVSAAISGVLLYDTGLVSKTQMLPDDMCESSLDFDVVSPRLGISVGRMRAECAKMEVSGREVGSPQPINTVVGQLQYRPIHCAHTARLGVLRLGDETLEPDPTVAHITGWYCPEATVVVRQEIEQYGQTQVIGVVELKHQAYRVQR